MSKFDSVVRFNDRARTYDKEIESIIPGYSTLHQLLYYILKNRLPGHANILIAGTGTSREAITLATENKGWNFVAFDTAEEMIKVSSGKIKRRGIGKQIKLVHGNINDVEEKMFDAATSVLVMHFIKNKKSFLNEIYSRIKPGGSFLLVDICGNKRTREFNELLSYWVDYQKDNRTDMESIKQTVKHIKKDLRAVSIEKTFTLLRDTGFKNTRHFFKSLLINGFIAEKPGR